MGKSLIYLGIILVIAGLLFTYGGKYFKWFGNLWGDIRIERENLKVYIPITSMLLLSLLLSLLVWIIQQVGNGK